jgi:hypothetical protein
VFLSLWCRPKSWISASGALQVRPPSLERLTSIALCEPSTSDGPMVARPMTYAVPSGEKSTHGSVTRSKSPLLPGAAPPQRDIGCRCICQLAPPSLLDALTNARALPLLQRSCCHAPSTRRASLRSIASHGSTSLCTNAWPDTAPPVQPAATGLGWLTCTSGGGAGGLGDGAGGLGDGAGGLGALVLVPVAPRTEAAHPIHHRRKHQARLPRKPAATHAHRANARCPYTSP